MGASAARSVETSVECDELLPVSDRRNRSLLTLTPQSSSIYAGTGNQDVIDNGENTLASDPLPIFTPDSAIRQHSGLVELDAFAMDTTSKRYLVGMKIFET